ncbi:MAG: Asp-tRNA(Asn)/Glu-tRNA(Gln) amidotransferase subunit GatA [Proteobacteria bacterium]|nr:Asp-tRNA(Asn)/Glu-tRNA(Gln) amidotransferase subunit GatA [Pseudomonadota bacterium]
MSALVEHTLCELAERVEAGEASCREIVAAHLERIERADGEIGALLGVRASEALEEAERADALRASGSAPSKLAGLPLAVKANLVSPQLESNCGSRILEGFRAPYQASCLERLREAGLVLLATANMDEFAMGSSCENSAFAATRNPWDPQRVPGGSSGGSAAAVAARMAPAALGSDTGGSIRQPAALCGVVGLKPTYGRVSRYGLVAFASSLDQIGPLARSAEDAAELLGLIAGHDPRDSTSVAGPVPDFRGALSGEVSGVRVGVPAEFFSREGADEESMDLVRQAVGAIEEIGARTCGVSLPHTEYGVATYYLLCTAEASSNLSRYDGVKYGFRAPADSLEDMYRRTRSLGFGAEVKRRILLGSYVLSAGYYDAYYLRAQRVRTLIRRDFEAAFETCDVIATPTVPGPAWPLGEKTGDPLQMYLSDVFTATVNLAGVPAVSIPCGFTRAGLPVGLQLIGPALGEETLLRVADAYQRHTDWHRRSPALPGH